MLSPFTLDVTNVYIDSLGTWVGVYSTAVERCMIEGTDC